MSCVSAERETNLADSMVQNLGPEQAGAQNEGDEVEGLPPAPPPDKFHTVNSEQLDKEKAAIDQVKDKMKETYRKLIKGEPFDEAPKAPKLNGPVGVAKEKAEKALKAAKTKAKEQTEKEVVKAKEKLKKKNAVAAEKAKEKAKKQKRAFLPLKGGPIQQAATARFDAYKKKLEAAKIAVKFAKKEVSQEELDRIDDLAATSLKRAKYKEAQAIKHFVSKARSKEQLKKAALKAEKTMKKADDEAEAAAKPEDKKEKTWECTPESCKAKCKTEQCLQWCTKCVTTKSEVMKYDPISQGLVVSHVEKHNRHPAHTVVPDIVAEGKRHLSHLEKMQKEADDWVDQKINEAKQGKKDVKADTAKKDSKETTEAKQGKKDAKSDTAKKGSKETTEAKQGEKDAKADAAKKDSKETSKDETEKKTNVAQKGSSDQKPAAKGDEGKSDVLRWASGVERPSTEKQVAAEVHVKIRQRQSTLIHAHNREGPGYFELQRGTIEKEDDKKETAELQPSS